jgi:hypothetical protein
MTQQQLERDVRFLKRYAMLTTAMLVVGCFAAFKQNPVAQAGGKVKFTEIDAERINIVEPDGKYRIVLSNRPRSIGPIYMGKPFGYEGGGRPGMLWFNDEGTENGGFTFTGTKCEDGTNKITKRPCRIGTYNAQTHFTFDQFDQDQIFVMNYNDQNGTRRVGLTISDRHNENIFKQVQLRDSILKNTPDTAAAQAAIIRAFSGTPENPGNAERLYIGRDAAKNAILNMRDPQGKPRLRLVVDSLGGARIEFLDVSGRVTNTINGARSGQ